MKYIPKTLNTITTTIKTNNLKKIITYNTFKTIPNTTQKTNI